MMTIFCVSFYINLVLCNLALKTGKVCPILFVQIGQVEFLKNFTSFELTFIGELIAHVTVCGWSIVCLSTFAKDITLTDLSLTPNISWKEKYLLLWLNSY